MRQSAQNAHIITPVQIPIMKATKMLYKSFCLFKPLLRKTTRPSFSVTLYIKVLINGEYANVQT